MNKLPTKQIYLLTIIIVGIIALSVYSTYALFTFEGSTSDIVSIHTPKSLQISENIYEYQQITVKPNSVVTTDIDIYNSHEYDVCYSIWYKLLGESIDSNKVQIFQKSDESLTTSGILTSLNNIRITLVIINDNDKNIKVNIGTIGEKIETESCSLNLPKDKNTINTYYGSTSKLTTSLLDKKDEIKETEASYLTYKNEDTKIKISQNNNIYVSNKFTYDKEIFTLDNPEKLTLEKTDEEEKISIEEIITKEYLENNDIYFCQDDTKCNILYKIIDIEKKTNINKDTNKEEIEYNIIKYDKLIGYTEGPNGLRKITETDYVYYGDNPDNFIYYNCDNNDDLNTCELWRIIGLFYNEKTDDYTTKIIRNDSIGKYRYDYNLINNENLSSNEWNNSSLSKYLNEEYKLKNNYDIYLEEMEQKLEVITSLDTVINKMKSSDKITTSKVTIATLSEQLLTSKCREEKISDYTDECLKQSWLNNIEIEREWTLTTKETFKNDIQNEDLDNTTEENLIDNVQSENNNDINYVYTIGRNILENNVNDILDIRPVIYLKSRMILVSGNGTLESPYIVR